MEKTLSQKQQVLLREGENKKIEEVIRKTLGMDTTSDISSVLDQLSNSDDNNHMVLHSMYSTRQNLIKLYNKIDTTSQENYAQLSEDITAAHDAVTADAGKFSTQLLSIIQGISTEREVPSADIAAFEYGLTHEQETIPYEKRVLDQLKSAIANPEKNKDQKEETGEGQKNTQGIPTEAINTETDPEEFKKIIEELTNYLSSKESLKERDLKPNFLKSKEEEEKEENNIKMIQGTAAQFNILSSIDRLELSDKKDEILQEIVNISPKSIKNTLKKAALVQIQNDLKHSGVTPKRRKKKKYTKY